MFKIGDKVKYKKHGMYREIRDIDENGRLLLWGMWQYINPDRCKNIRNALDYIKSTETEER